ncbi:hypothetical protein [Labilibaculum sp. K2S]|nr:hypothetical protein [Labilibaculum sp. K2S]
MKTKKESKVIKELNRNELALTKGGNERAYIIVIIDGKEVRIYV